MTRKLSHKPRNKPHLHSREWLRNNKTEKENSHAVSFSNFLHNRRFGMRRVWVAYQTRQKRWRLPCRKRAVKFRKMRHLLTFTGVQRSENPRFFNCFAVGEFEYSFHYPVFSHYGNPGKRLFSGIERSVNSWRMTCLPVFTDVFPV